MNFPIEVNLYNNTHIIVIDDIKFDLICLLGIEDEDKNDIKDDFFINKCFGNNITKEELIIEYDKLYKIYKVFQFKFDILTDKVLLNDIIKRNLYEFKENFYIKKYTNKWYLYEINDTIVFYPNGIKKIGINKFLCYNNKYYYVSHIDDYSLTELIKKLNDNDSCLIYEDNQGHGIDVSSKDYGLLFSTFPGTVEEFNEYFTAID